MIREKRNKRILEMWVVGERRIKNIVVFRKNKKMVLYRDKPTKKKPWDVIEKIQVILPVFRRK